MLERLSFLDDPGFPTELGDGEGEEDMHMSEARAELYDAIEKWEHRKDDATMSRLPWKEGYQLGEMVSLDPQEWSVTRIGMMDRIDVTYKTGGDELIRHHEWTPPEATADMLEAMLSVEVRKYPD